MELRGVRGSGSRKVPTGSLNYASLPEGESNDSLFVSQTTHQAVEKKPSSGGQIHLYANLTYQMTFKFWDFFGMIKSWVLDIFRAQFDKVRFACGESKDSPSLLAPQGGSGDIST